jgi:hypothetical protein
MTGDGVHDYLVGQPGYDDVVKQDVGAVRLVHGVSHLVLTLRYGDEQGAMFGSAIASLGDASGDGVSEVVIGAPGPNSLQSHVHMFSDGSLFLASGPATTFPGIITFNASGSARIGAASPAAST